MKLRKWSAALASVLAIGAWTFGCTDNEATSPAEIASACTGGHDTMDPTCNLCLGDLCCAGDCLGASCCEEYRDCTIDTGCRTCLSTPMSAGCVANPLVLAVNNCSSAHCAAACQ